MVPKLKQAFTAAFSTEPTLIVKAPGRINLIGEHTDYNGGLVFPAAIDKCMYFAFRPNGSQLVNIVAQDKSARISVKLDDLVSDILWGRYCLGVISEFQKLQLSVIGFDCLFMSEIPIGAGVSSSAALECGFAKGIDHLIGSNLDRWELARIGNRSENNFLGIQSGILDQFSSLFGKANSAMLMDCSTQTFEYYPIDLDPYCLVLINTNVKHSHLSSGYNDRPSECKAILEIANQHNITLQHLSELTHEQLKAIKPHLSRVLYNRALFILEENVRVLAFKEAMLMHDHSRLGEILYDCHDGLSRLYEVSCKELDILVSITKEHNSVLGARMMGGGFGGCTLNLLLQKNKESTIQAICQAYHKQTNIDATPYSISIGNGVELVSSDM